MCSKSLYRGSLASDIWCSRRSSTGFTSLPTLADVRTPRHEISARYTRVQLDSRHEIGRCGDGHDSGRGVETGDEPETACDHGRATCRHGRCSGALCGTRPSRGVRRIRIGDSGGEIVTRTMAGCRTSRLQRDRYSTVLFEPDPNGDADPAEDSVQGVDAGTRSRVRSVLSGHVPTECRRRSDA